MFRLRLRCPSTCCRGLHLRHQHQLGLLHSRLNPPFPQSIPQASSNTAFRVRYPISVQAFQPRLAMIVELETLTGWLSILRQPPLRSTLVTGNTPTSPKTPQFPRSSEQNFTTTFEVGMTAVIKCQQRTHSGVSKPWTRRFF